LPKYIEGNEEGEMERRKKLKERKWKGIETRK
jgi:hypothetical protein